MMKNNISAYAVIQFSRSLSSVNLSVHDW